MGSSSGDAPRLFFVHVRDELPPRRSDRTRNVGARDQHGEVSHVHRVLLLEMNVEELTRHLPGGERGPRPVTLAFHHAEQRFSEL